MGVNAMRAENISYSVGKLPILQPMSVEIPSQKLTGLIGPNGAGKSTLLRVLSGLRKPDHGAVFLRGQNIAATPERTRARTIAMVPQSLAVGFGFTVSQIVAMGRHPYLRRLEPLSARCHSMIEDAMHATETMHLRHRLVTELSGGEQQRVFLARALAQEPDILILDEPTANLDVRYQLELFDLIARLRQERSLTVVMALHDLTWALRYCDHAILLNHGHLVAAGPPTDVITDRTIGEVFGVKAQRVEGSSGPLIDILSL